MVTFWISPPSSFCWKLEKLISAGAA